MSISLPLVAGGLWVVAAAIVALLPMRMQYPPGILLLILAPVLIFWIGAVHGWVLAAFGTFAFVSMFRNPIRYFALKAMGRAVRRPEEEGR